MLLKIFVLFLGLGIHAQEIEEADVESLSKEVEVMVDSPAPTAKPSGQFLSGQTWQPWAQQMMRGGGQFLSGQTWQPWAQPQNQQLGGQTWQPWAQPQNQYLSGQTWQPWAQQAQRDQQLSGQTWQLQPEQLQNQQLAGQTWQPWAQPQNQQLGGQTWQPWAQPQNQYLPGQTWQPAQPASVQPAAEPVAEPAKLMNSQPMLGADFNPNDFQAEFSPSGSVKASQTGVFPISEPQPAQNQKLSGQTWQPWAQQLAGQTWNQAPVQPQQAWNFNPNYPVYYKDMTEDDKVTDVIDEDFSEGIETTTQDPTVFVPGPPTWRKSWAPMPGKKPGCFNRCKNRCGAGYGNPGGCRASCRGGCNLRPSCGRNRGKMVGNTMVCPFANKNNNVINNGGFLSGQTWQPWAQPQNQRPFIMGQNTQTNYAVVPQTNQALTQSASVEVEDVDIENEDYAAVIGDMDELSPVADEPEMKLEE